MTCCVDRQGARRESLLPVLGIDGVPTGRTVHDTTRETVHLLLPGHGPVNAPTWVASCEALQQLQDEISTDPGT